MRAEPADRPRARTEQARETRAPSCTVRAPSCGRATLRKVPGVLAPPFCGTPPGAGPGARGADRAARIDPVSGAAAPRQGNTAPMMRITLCCPRVLWPGWSGRYWARVGSRLMGSTPRLLRRGSQRAKGCRCTSRGKRPSPTQGVHAGAHGHAGKVRITRLSFPRMVSM